MWVLFIAWMLSAFFNDLPIYCSPQHNQLWEWITIGTRNQLRLALFFLVKYINHYSIYETIFHPRYFLYFFMVIWNLSHQSQPWIEWPNHKPKPPSAAVSHKLCTAMVLWLQSWYSCWPFFSLPAVLQLPISIISAVLQFYRKHFPTTSYVRLVNC